MKKIIKLFVILLLVTSCKKNQDTAMVPPIQRTQNTMNAAGKNTPSTISICHRTNSSSNPWIMMEVNTNALSAHLAHGDIVPDADGDGYTKVNPCSTGSQDDCDDDNADTNPGALEICDGIDNNCNGLIDDNCTTVATICNQVWMAKNLEVTKYRNGDDIPQVTDATTWANLTTGAWCYANNNPANGLVYGKLYNWYAVTDPRGLAPTGWHIPSNNEWQILTNCVGAELVGGGPLKEAGTAHWHSPNAGATNSSGFTGLPGGLRDRSSSTNGIGNLGFWWSTNESNPNYAWANYLIYIDPSTGPTSRNKNEGLSVRCVKD